MPETNGHPVAPILDDIEPMASYSPVRLPMPATVKDARIPECCRGTVGHAFFCIAGQSTRVPFRVVFCTRCAQTVHIPFPMPPPPAPRAPRVRAKKGE